MGSEKLGREGRKMKTRTGPLENLSYCTLTDGCFVLYSHHQSGPRTITVIEPTHWLATWRLPPQEKIREYIIVKQVYGPFFIEQWVNQ
jgi:hypothetical protein